MIEIQVQALRRISLTAIRALDLSSTPQNYRMALTECAKLAEEALGLLPTAVQNPAIDPARPASTKATARLVFERMAKELSRPDLFAPPCDFNEGVRRLRNLIHETGMAEKVPAGQSATYKMLFETVAREPLGAPAAPAGDPDTFFRECT